MMAAEEAAAGRQRRWVHRFQDQMHERVYQGLFGDGVIAPKDEYEMFPLFRKSTDGRIGELFPTMMRMRSCLSSAHRQRGIQQQHSFPRPLFEVARTRHGHAKVVVQLFKDVLEAGRERHTVRHRERKAVRLSGTMIGILT